MFGGGNTNFSALIIELLQKIQILTNEPHDQKYSTNILLVQSILLLFYSEFSYEKINYRY